MPRGGGFGKEALVRPTGLSDMRMSDYETAAMGFRVAGGKLEYGLGSEFITSIGGAALRLWRAQTASRSNYKSLTGPRHLQGMATFYLKPHRYKGKNRRFMPRLLFASLTGSEGELGQLTDAYCGPLGNSRPPLSEGTGWSGLAMQL
jgi:hypothetical protein